MLATGLPAPGAALRLTALRSAPPPYPECQDRGSAARYAARMRRQCTNPASTASTKNVFSPQTPLFPGYARGRSPPATGLRVLRAEETALRCPRFGVAGIRCSLPNNVRETILMSWGEKPTSPNSPCPLWLVSLRRLRQPSAKPGAPILFKPPLSPLRGVGRSGAAPALLGSPCLPPFRPPWGLPVQAPRGALLPACRPAGGTLGAACSCRPLFSSSVAVRYDATRSTSPGFGRG